MGWFRVSHASLFALFMTVAAMAHPAAPPAPGTLVSTRSAALSQVSAESKPPFALPEGGGRARVLVCVYRASKGTGVTEVRRFWQGLAPAWITTVAASDRLHDAVEGVAADCPLNLAGADSLQDSSDVRLAANQQWIAKAEQIAPRQPPAARPAGAPAERTGVGLSSFSASGLNYEHEVTAIYLGDFQHSRLKSDSLDFGVLLGSYIGSYSRLCADYLPANKVEIMESYCKTERVMVNKYGGQVGAPTCGEYGERGTGRFADPDLDAASKRLAAQSTDSVLGDVFGSMRDAKANPMASSMRVMDAATSVGNDMDVLLRTNNCASLATKHFQHNLLSFANNVPGEAVNLPAGSPLMKATSEGMANLTRELDAARLLNDLILEQSKAWMLNHYVNGSASNTRVTRDPSGRAAHLEGTYMYNSLGKETQGNVTVDFVDGLPHCLFFSDFPDTCRSASRRVMTAYENGGYAR